MLLDQLFKTGACLDGSITFYIKSDNIVFACKTPDAESFESTLDTFRGALNETTLEKDTHYREEIISNVNEASFILNSVGIAILRKQSDSISFELPERMLFLLKTKASLRDEASSAAEAQEGLWKKKFSSMLVKIMKGEDRFFHFFESEEGSAFTATRNKLLLVLQSKVTILEESVAKELSKALALGLGEYARQAEIEFESGEIKSVGFPNYSSYTWGASWAYGACVRLSDRLFEKLTSNNHLKFTPEKKEVTVRKLSPPQSHFTRSDRASSTSSRGHTKSTSSTGSVPVSDDPTQPLVPQESDDDTSGCCSCVVM